MTDEHDFDFDEETPPSKSQRKREMLQLQTLGERLAELPAAQRAQFAITPSLETAIADYHRISKREAKRRQLQYIGKLMRAANHEQIAETFARMDAEQGRQLQLHPLIESWRDRLLTGDNQALTDFLNDYPQADRQQLRQAIRLAVKEQSAGQPPTHNRKLFRLLREIMTNR